MGPNVKKLIFHRASQLIIPESGGIGDVVDAIRTPSKLVEATREATEWVKAAIQAVKSAPGPNPYGDNDEAIAGEILRQIEIKKRESWLA